MVQRSDFPSDFAWGTATASYQNEGATAEGGRGTSIWDTFARSQNAINDGSAGEIADDHYHRYAEDVQLMSDLNLNSYRFSIAWPRIQPMGTGAPNAAGLDFYKRLADELLAKDIAPYATLYHWDLPQALEDHGGWMIRDTALRFEEYVRIVVEELKDRIPNWITLNEPWVSAFTGYAQGTHAPGRQYGGKSLRAAYHLSLAHGLGARAIREIAPEANLGVTLSMSPAVPWSESAEDAELARVVDDYNIALFLDPMLLGTFPTAVTDHVDGFADWLAEQPSEDLETIKAPIDFMGINYYRTQTVTAPNEFTDPRLAYPGLTYRDMELGNARTHMGWAVDPEGIISCMRKVQERVPGMPVYVTENGAAYDDQLVDGEVHDELRRDYIEQHIDACSRALAEGIPLKGYFIWTLMDNWEWSFGYSRKFGLIRVDHRDQKRIVKDSGRWLAGWLAE